jgi:hypothetical protein
MTKYGLQFDYIETARTLETRHGGNLASDHACDPIFSYPGGSTAWHVVDEDDFHGVVGGGFCSKCDRRALLRVPQHLVVAVRLLKGGHTT